MLALAEALDIRDARTARHSQTVARLAELIARELGLSGATVEQRAARRPAARRRQHRRLRTCCSASPSPLSDEEWNEIRRHSEIGARILANARLGDIGEWVLAHHERVGRRRASRSASRTASIPLEARILAVADAFEAMTSERAAPARAHPRWTRCEELRRNAGTQFDAEVVDAFVRALAQDRVGSVSDCELRS